MGSGEGKEGWRAGRRMSGYIYGGACLTWVTDREREARAMLGCRSEGVHVASARRAVIAELGALYCSGLGTGQSEGQRNFYINTNYPSLIV